MTKYCFLLLLVMKADVTHACSYDEYLCNDACISDKLPCNEACIGDIDPSNIYGDLTNDLYYDCATQSCVSLQDLTWNCAGTCIKITEACQGDCRSEFRNLNYLSLYNLEYDCADNSCKAFHDLTSWMCEDGCISIHQHCSRKCKDGWGLAVRIFKQVATWFLCEETDMCIYSHLPMCWADSYGLQGENNPVFGFDDTPYNPFTLCPSLNTTMVLHFCKEKKLVSRNCSEGYEACSGHIPGQCISKYDKNVATPSSL